MTAYWKQVEKPVEEGQTNGEHANNVTGDATEKVDSDEEGHDWTEAKLDVAITKLKGQKNKSW